MMAFTTRAGFGEDLLTITTVIRNASMGITPIKFGRLGTGLAVPPNRGAEIQLSTHAGVVRTTTLITCAAVCYVREDRGYVYHANAGSVSQTAFQTALDAIHAHAPYHDVYIAYAHPNASDGGYQGDIANLVAWGIPTNNVVELTHVFLPEFGLNNLLQLGY
jgi:hypothetical protein